MTNKYKRKYETFYAVSPFIAEFWNTITNLAFILIGLARLIELSYEKCEEYEKIYVLYILYILCGVASAIHHAMGKEWSIIIDWLPISISIILNLYWKTIYFVSLGSSIKLFIAFMTLLCDHVWTLIPVPWGHCIWHVLAAFSIDSAYQDFYT